MDISFVIPNRNNLKYFKWAYESIRSNEGRHNVYICSALDDCNDGSETYYKELVLKDDKFSFIINNSGERLGHTILYDKIIKDLVKTEIAIIYHCDMYLAPNALDSIEKHIKPSTIVSLTRIEPPLHPDGPEKIVYDLGTEPEDFKEQDFINLLYELNSLDTNPHWKGKIPEGYVSEGVFAPWAFYVKDFVDIGGHDALYRPQSKEDSDIFNRFHLNGIKFIQTWEGFVYHMTCRGSRYNPQLTQVGTESKEWLDHNRKSTRNFIRKWGHMVKHDKYMRPIVIPKYDITFEVKGSPNIDIIKELEPWATRMYCHCQDYTIQEYITKEQGNTDFDLKSRVFPISSFTGTYSGIHVEIDIQSFTNQDFNSIINLQEILSTSLKSPGDYELANLSIKVISMDTYEKDNIVTKSNQF